MAPAALQGVTVAELGSQAYAHAADKGKKVFFEGRALAKLGEWPHGYPRPVQSCRTDAWQVAGDGLDGANRAR